MGMAIDTNLLQKRTRIDLKYKKEEEKRDLGLDGAFDKGPEAGHRYHKQPKRRVIARRRVPYFAGDV